MPSISFREDITPQEIIAIVYMAVLSVIAFAEALSFTVFVTYTEYKNPKREPSLIRRIFSKFNFLLWTMFTMEGLWSSCACYSIIRTHNNFSLIGPQAVQTFSFAIIKICYMHCCWAISVSILRRNSGPAIFRAGSIIVTLAPFVFFSEATLFIVGIQKASNSKIIITTDKIFVFVGGVGEVLFCVYLVYVFTKTLYRQRRDLDELSSEERVSTESRKSVPSVLGEDSQKQQRQFRTISRHGIVSCCFCFLALAVYSMELVNGLEEWINTFEVAVQGMVNCAVLTLFVMKVRLDFQRNEKNGLGERAAQVAIALTSNPECSKEQRKSVEPVRTLGRNSFNAKVITSS
ncbi:hypothetical protein BCR33DRAFT_96836 [Rhizoclosmatium globosum]|uniref:Uncharacterized protein n=1 Tax=Rhizoclosmatium globosum TaxID=329046 RepID=A0A1Y2CKD1_9FUNG|nr:hypothetical protein BCR33DRAFT_96836 [Rhizoclosmatium globosum]|eukprot:ORY47417.1 hypothetical protein BCR33DRAFT_96836 [Rhizoclosmatium globosum]